jgi:hypothetical protein
LNVSGLPNDQHANERQNQIGLIIVAFQWPVASPQLADLTVPYLELRCHCVTTLMYAQYASGTVEVALRQSYSWAMAVYLARNCPKCRNYFG